MILADRGSGFAVRAVTRKPDSDPVVELENLGAQVARADMDAPASLAPAFEHAYAACLVTDFWEHTSAEREKARARALADAAGHAGGSTRPGPPWTTPTPASRWTTTACPPSRARTRCPGADEAGNMFQYCADCFSGARVLDAVRGLDPELRTFATWLDAHRDRMRTAWT